MSEANRNFARSEAANIRACNHPNIIKLIETFESGDKLLHILEYADAGDLYNQVELRARHNAQNTERQPVFYQENEILVILSQLFLAVQYIHDRRILHRDLKTPNVMLMKHGLIKLGDFGFSRQYEESVSTNVGNTFCGTPYYLAPELWQRQPYSYKAEIWSLGVIAYELMMLQKPFPAHDFNDLMQRVCRERSYLPIPADRYSPQLIHLVEYMLRVDPNRRPNIKQVLAAPIMQQKGLPLLKINVRRLRNLDPAICAQLVAEVDYTLAQAAAAAPTEESFAAANAGPPAAPACAPRSALPVPAPAVAVAASNRGKR
ncbi:protein kinase [Strigomonas culicis]|nr:protein kinase [Strigomonas culicis]|eukprot:EPY32717.1 protein kinase [Strigomonas culicis]